MLICLMDGGMDGGMDGWMTVQDLNHSVTIEEGRHAHKHALLLPILPIL